MYLLKGARARTALAAAALALVAAVVPTTAQSVRAGTRRRPARTRRQGAPQAAPIHFRDLTVSSFDEATMDVGQSATFTGPDTTVDATDPKQPGAKSRLQASKITVLLTPKTANEVDRVEASGNLRFAGSKPQTDTSPAQRVEGTGSRATYFRKEDRVVVDGPVTYYAEQPTTDTKAAQWVRGTAGHAVYDRAKDLLTLSDSVRAKVMAETLTDPADINGDTVVIDLANRPYKITIRNTSPAKGRVHFVPAEKPKEEKKP